MNRDKACLHPLVWPDVCGHGDEAYVGTVRLPQYPPWHTRVADVYVYEPDHEFPMVCLRTGALPYQHNHLDLDTFWVAADAYPPWHPARDLLLSQGFVP